VDEMTLSRKGAKSRRRITGLRSKTTKARTHVDRLRAADADLKKKLAEALEQQTGTSEVLGVISNSPAELEPVFQAMLENATRICEAKFGTLYLREGDGFRAVAMHNAPPAYTAARTAVVHPPADSGLGRAARTKQVVHIADVTKSKGYLEGNAYVAAAVERTSARTLLLVPMLKDDVLVGVIGIYRQEVRPFIGKQIALVQSFAAQAVIAIENTRLLNELRERTSDLGEAMEQQTATSEVLQVISSSPRDLESVFQAILSNATRICEAKFGTLYLCDADAFRLVAMYNAPPLYAKSRQRLVRPPPDTVLGRVSVTKQVVHITDIREAQSYIERNSYTVSAVELGGYRTVLGLPMLKQNDLIGVVIICRQEVRPFTETQIDLVRNFAKQAVIAIENARLLNELLLEFWHRAKGTLPEKIEKADLRTLNLGLGFLFRRLRQAQARFEQEGDSDRQSVFSALGAFWSFITLFEGPFAENLHVPIMLLQDALVMLDHGETKPMLKPVRRPRGGRAPSSQIHASLRGHAAATVQLLRQAGLARDDAHKAVATELRQLGVRPQRGSGTVTATTVGNWCDRVAEDVGRHGTAAMMYEHKLARGRAMLSAFPKDQARQLALEELTYWIRTLLPELRKPI